LIQPRKATGVMMLRVAIERAHQPIDACGVLMHNLHSACAGEMAARQFLAHCVEPCAGGLTWPTAALELREQRTLVTRDRGRRHGAIFGKPADRSPTHRLPTAASASK